MSSLIPTLKLVGIYSDVGSGNSAKSVPVSTWKFGIATVHTSQYVTGGNGGTLQTALVAPGMKVGVIGANVNGAGITGDVTFSTNAMSLYYAYVTAILFTY